MMMTLDGLDMEVIIVEILPKLPVKTLIRFKSVCKSLNSVISSRDFTRFYLRHQPAAEKRLALAGYDCINCYHLDPHATTTTTTTFVYDETSASISSFIGTSNGMLCIRLTRRGNSSEYYCILNPTTRIYRCIHTLDEEPGVGYNHGFGFDHENLDYIIVLVSEYHTKFPMKTTTLITRVYSLNNNCWNVVSKTTFPTDTMQALRRYGVLINNNLLHWMFSIPALHKNRICCFDICKNKWTDDVLLPRFYYKEITYLVDFGVVDDCLFSTFKDRIEKRYNVWVMKEYGVQESWIMLLSIPDFNCFQGKLIKPVASCRSSETVLLRQRYTSRLFLYNKVDGRVSEAKFDGTPSFWNLQAYMGSGSLVDIPGGQVFEHIGIFKN